jgi:hypothetical protein
MLTKLALGTDVSADGSIPIVNGSRPDNFMGGTRVSDMQLTCGFHSVR